LNSTATLARTVEREVAATAGTSRRALNASAARAWPDGSVHAEEVSEIAGRGATAGTVEIAVAGSLNSSAARAGSCGDAGTRAASAGTSAGELWSRAASRA
jgi:hypothetical protein